MTLVLSEAEIQLAELVSEHFTGYGWAVPHLAALRERRRLFAEGPGKERDKNRVYKRYGKILVYCLPLLLLVLQGDIYSTVKFGAQIVGVRAAVISHQPIGRPVSQLEKVEPALGHIIPADARPSLGCLNLTVNEMARWKAAGLRELREFCS